MNSKITKALFLSFIIFQCFTSAFAGSYRTTYQAKIIKPNGLPLEASSVQFKFTILDPSGVCILYSESFSNVNMTAGGGLVSFPLGSGIRSYPVSGTAATFSQIFDNSAVSFACQASGSYFPTSDDNRRLVVQFHDGSGWQTVPSLIIDAVPYAMFASKSQNTLLLNNKSDTSFVEYSTLMNLNCTINEALAFNGVGFSCISVGGSIVGVTSSSVITALGYIPVNGTSFTSVSSGLNAVSSTLTSLESTLTSLSQTMSASFAAITSTPWLTSGTSVYYSAGAVGLGTNSPQAVLHEVVPSGSGDAIIADYFDSSAGSAGLVFRKARGTQGTASAVILGDKLGSIGARGYGTTGFSPFSRGSIIFKATENWTDAAQGSAIVFETTNNSSISRVERLRLDHNGYLGLGTSSPVTKLDITGGIKISMESANCISSFSGAIRYNTSKIEYCNGSSWLELVSASDLNYTLSSLSTLDLGSASATGLLNEARLPNFANIASGSAYSRVTVDGKGRVTSGGQLTFSDITSALGYTPISSGSVASSQWNNSGTNLHYNTGNIGIGSSNPTKTLVVGDGTFNADFELDALTDSWFYQSKAGNQQTYFGYRSLTDAFTIGASMGGGIYLDRLVVQKLSGNVGVGTTTPVTKLEVNGGVRIGSESNGCTVSFAGTIRYNSNKIEFCNGNSWDAFSVSTFSSVDLGSASATGILAEARLLTQARITSGSQYTKVTVDGKGRITSGTSLSTSDVVTALGFIPANSLAVCTPAGSITPLYNTCLNNGLGVNTTGERNTALGHNSMVQNTTGNRNSSVGQGSLYSNTTGNQNTGIGSYSLFSNINGSYNTGVGDAAGYSISSGANNIAIGYNSGNNITTGSNNVVIGANAQVASGSASNQLNINNLIYGASGFVGIGTNAPTELLEISGSSPELVITGTNHFNYSGGAVVLRSQSSDNGRAQGFYMHNSNSQTEWFAGRPYATSSDSFVIARKSSLVANHDRSTAASGNSFLTVTASGSVGIGENNPTSTLEVNGKVSATAFGLNIVQITASVSTPAVGGTQGATVTATCPANYTVMSGGCKFSSAPFSGRIQENSPISSTQWNCKAYHDSGPTQYAVVATAVCVKTQ